jgi:hypothetical protein
MRKPSRNYWMRRNWDLPSLALRWESMYTSGPLAHSYRVLINAMWHHSIYYHGLKSKPVFSTTPPDVTRFDNYFMPTAIAPSVDVDSIVVNPAKSAYFHLSGLHLEITKVFSPFPFPDDGVQEDMLNIPLLHDLVVGVTCGYIYGAINAGTEEYTQGVEAAMRALQLPILSPASTLAHPVIPVGSRSRDRRFGSPSSTVSPSLSISTSPLPMSPTFKVRPLILPALRDATPPRHRHRHSRSPSPGSPTPTPSPVARAIPDQPSLTRQQLSLCTSIRVHLHYIIALHQFAANGSTRHWRYIVELASQNNTGGIGVKEGDLMVAKARRRLEAIAFKSEKRPVSVVESGYFSNTDTFSTYSMTPPITPSLSSSVTSLPRTTNIGTHSLPPRILRRVKSSSSLSTGNPPKFHHLPPSPPLPLQYHNPTDRHIRSAAPSPLVATDTATTLPLASWTKNLRRRASATARLITSSFEPAPPLPVSRMLKSLLAKDDRLAGDVICWDFEGGEEDEAVIEITVEEVMTMHDDNQGIAALAERKGKGKGKGKGERSSTNERSFFDPTRLAPRPAFGSAHLKPYGDSICSSTSGTPAVMTMDPTLEALERNSRLSAISTCSSPLCDNREFNLSQCASCAMSYCSRSCRVSVEGGRDGERHVCISLT